MFKWAGFSVVRSWEDCNDPLLSFYAARFFFFQLYIFMILTIMQLFLGFEPLPLGEAEEGELGLVAALLWTKVRSPPSWL